ncbi:MAG: hypothetical protein H6544_02570 [Prevotellaceae bacterium]|nr:hypothetical protein [Prevotellaceae bacterium]
MKKLLFLLLGTTTPTVLCHTKLPEPIKNNFIAEWGRLKLVGNQLSTKTKRYPTYGMEHLRSPNRRRL